MLRKLLTTTVLAIGLGAAATVTAPTTADAGRFFWRPHFHHDFDRGRFFRFHDHGPFFGGIYLGGPVIYDYPTYPVYGFGPCHWLRIRALETGSRYWWRRWRECIGY